MLTSKSVLLAKVMAMPCVNRGQWCVCTLVSTLWTVWSTWAIDGTSCAICARVCRLQEGNSAMGQACRHMHCVGKGCGRCQSNRAMQHTRSCVMRRVPRYFSIRNHRGTTSVFLCAPYRSLMRTCYRCHMGANSVYAQSKAYLDTEQRFV